MQRQKRPFLEVLMKKRNVVTIQMVWSSCSWKFETKVNIQKLNSTIMISVHANEILFSVTEKQNIDITIIMMKLSSK